MKKITKLTVTYDNSPTFTLTSDGISPSYDSQPYAPAMLQEAIVIWKRHFGALPLLSLPTPETVDPTNATVYMSNVFAAVDLLGKLHGEDPVPILSGLLFDVASLLAIWEKLAADHG